MFRIVAEKRGEAVIGFRVQVMGRTMRFSCENGELVRPWRNRGRRVYTVADAENLRAFFEYELSVVMPRVTYEEIPPKGDDVGSPL